MSTKEQAFVTIVLISIVALVGTDLVTDFREGVRWWHLLVEGATGLGALAGVYFILRSSFTLRKTLALEQHTSSALRAEAEKWRSEAKKHLDGLSRSIDQQLTGWNLTESEKEIAFLLIKGLSLKEIAAIRNTSEKTVRAQAISVYSKSGLTGRAELAAFFLEDLLAPSE